MKQVYLLLMALLLLGCTPATTPAPNPTNTPHLFPAAIPAGGMVVLPLGPAGTPEANPILIVEGTIIDAATKQAVQAEVYVVNSVEERAPIDEERVLKASQHFELKLLSQLNGWLVVRAPGYEDWKLRLNYRIKTSRVLDAPIELKKSLAKTTT